MNKDNEASERVASFEVRLTRFIDENGEALSALPAFTQDAAELRRMLHSMVVTRAFDQKAVALQRTGQLGTYASCLGQEAVGTGVGLSLRHEDIYVPAYREYAAQFLRGTPMHRVLQYWSGDERGSLVPQDCAAFHDFPYSVPIATHLTHAVGVAYAMKLRGQARVVLSSCGDGATSKGDFYEALNAAAVWQLPLVFLISNNQWAISVPRANQSAAQTLAQKAIAAGMDGEQVDGNDVIAVRYVLSEAIERARSGHGPQLVEALTYRLHDHTTADDARRYRDQSEVDQAWSACPIKRLTAFMQAAQNWSDDDQTTLAAEAAAEVAQAVERYLSLEPAPPDAMFEHLYAELPTALLDQRHALQAQQGGSA